MYQRVLWMLTFLIVLSVVSLGRTAVVTKSPEGPTGHTTCSDQLDNDKDGLVDNCAGSSAWSSCTGGYCAEIENGILFSPLVEVADATFSDSAYVHIPLGNSWFTSQVMLCNTGGTAFADGTYYLHLRSVVPSAARPWVWISLDTPFTPPLPPDNAKAMLFFNGQAQPTPAWDLANMADSAANFGTLMVGTDPKTFALNGTHCFYFLPSPEIKLDAAYLTTSATQEPQTGGGGGGGGTVDYEIKELGANTITVNGACTEGAWTNATVLTFGGGGTSTNGITWKMLWDNTTTDKLYGCVTVTDTDLRATTTANDTGTIFSDDAIEFIHSNDEVPNFDATTFKTVINIAATQAHLDRYYPGGVDDDTHTANITKARVVTGDLDDTADDTSYVIEWSQDLGFNAATDQLILGNFRVDDKDGTFTFKDAFGTGDLNDMTQWATIKLSATTVPDQPADTTAPTFPDTPDCSESGIGQTGATITCSVAETGTTPVTCRVRYDTDNDAAISGGDAVTTSTVTASGGTSPYTCTVSLGGLSAGTTYYYVVDAFDGAANPGTSAEDSFTTTATAGATFYISPTGNNANAGTSAAPWRTFAFALAQMDPGETLLLKNGTYSTAAATGYPSINCSSGYRNGTSTQPITVKAENERQAHISGTGAGFAFQMYNCSYWVIEGLHISNADNSGNSTTGATFYGVNNHNLKIRRNLLRNPNRYDQYAHCLEIGEGSSSLIEENEAYNFHRHAFLVRNQTLLSGNHIIRRNYAHSRNTVDVPGVTTNLSTRGDDCFIAYPSADNIWENNICENSERAFEAVPVPGSFTARNNRFFGNISVDSYRAAMLTAPYAGVHVVDALFVNHLGLSGASIGVQVNCGINARFNNLSLLSSSVTNYGFFADRDPGHSHADPCSIFSDNSLVVSYPNATGWQISGQTNWLLDYSSSFGNAVAYSPPASDSHITNEVTSNPNLGSCKVLIPAGSPLKGTGKAGADIGATIIYQYANGVLTSTPLWDAADSYQFTGCSRASAIVAGVNDSAGNSCVNVQQRLDVGAAEGCTLPY